MEQCVSELGGRGEPRVRARVCVGEGIGFVMDA